MKLSIWQQFSSNHSSHYFVVGVFGSSEAANQAETELKTMLQEIDLWHRQNPLAVRENPSPDLVPPEREAAKKYGVEKEWQHTIDWASWASYWFEQSNPQYDAAENAALCIDQAVRVLENVVVAATPDQSWMGRQPFKGLLEHFGAKTFAYDLEHFEGWDKCFFRLTCIAPDETIAQKFKLLAENIDLLYLTVIQDHRRLTCEFHHSSVEGINNLRDLLQSNGYENIQFDVFEKAE
jgi:hypothetical protein